jgi:hypothetical protein
MRFIITSTTAPDSKLDAPMTDDLFKAYMKFNEDLHAAGVLVVSEGLMPGTPGARIVASGGKRKVVDGPFLETKELVGGFYVIEVPSLEEAKAWALRCPVGMASADVLEVRQLTASEDIPQQYLDLAASVAPSWTASFFTKKK